MRYLESELENSIFNRLQTKHYIALLISAPLGFGAAISCALALLLAGRGAWLLGESGGARAAAAGIFGLGALAAAAICAMLSPALGKAARDRRAPEEEARAPTWLAAAALLALLVFSGAVVAQSLRAPDGAWDAWAIWNARARSLLRSAGDVRLACAPERGLAMATLHPDYPLLLPTAIALGWRVLGRESPLVPALASILPALLAVALAAQLAARTARSHGLWMALLVLTTPELAQMAAAQYAEAALGALVVAGAGLLLLAWDEAGNESSRRSLVALAGFAFGAAALVKHEGMLWLAAAALVAARARPRDLLAMALGAALPLAIALWFARAFAPPGDLTAGGLAALAARANVRRLLPIALGLLRRIVYVQAWGLHLAAFAALLGLRMFRRDLAPAARRLLALCALVLGGFLLAYWTTPHDPAWHLRTSIDRLLLQLWIPALIATSLPPLPGAAQRDPASA